MKVKINKIKIIEEKTRFYKELGKLSDAPKKQMEMLVKNHIYRNANYNNPPVNVAHSDPLLDRLNRKYKTFASTASLKDDPSFTQNDLKVASKEVQKMDKKIGRELEKEYHNNPKNFQISADERIVNKHAVGDSFIDGLKTLNSKHYPPQKYWPTNPNDKLTISHGGGKQFLQALLKGNNSKIQGYVDNDGYVTGNSKNGPTAKMPHIQVFPFREKHNDDSGIVNNVEHYAQRASSLMGDTPTKLTGTIKAGDLSVGPAAAASISTKNMRNIQDVKLQDFSNDNKIREKYNPSGESDHKSYLYKKMKINQKG